MLNWTPSSIKRKKFHIFIKEERFKTTTLHSVEGKQPEDFAWKGGGRGSDLCSSPSGCP